MTNHRFLHLLKTNPRFLHMKRHLTHQIGSGNHFPPQHNPNYDPHNGPTERLQTTGLGDGIRHNHRRPTPLRFKV